MGENMTLETYRKATEILETEEWLEELKESLDQERDSEIYIDVCNRLFKLGQEFANL